MIVNAICFQQQVKERSIFMLYLIVVVFVLPLYISIWHLAAIVVYIHSSAFGQLAKAKTQTQPQKIGNQ